MFLLWNVVIKCLALCLITSCFLSSPFLASPAHLYMPHLFTHLLPTIICVMLMSIAFFFIFAICYFSLWFYFGLFVYISLTACFLCHFILAVYFFAYDTVLLLACGYFDYDLNFNLFLPLIHSSFKEIFCTSHNQACAVAGERQYQGKTLKPVLPVCNEEKPQNLPWKNST